MKTADGTFWVYILENAVGRFYIGQTDDVARRVCEHNEASVGHTTYTHKNGPCALIWQEEHADRSSAMRREGEIKAKKSAKWIREHLLMGRVPTSRD